MKPPAAGPTIEASPKEAPSIPWYLPRSRGRDDVADDRLRQRHDESHAGTLDEAGEDQEPEVGREARHRRPDGEYDDARHVQRLASVDVRQLAGDWDDDRRGQHRRARDPAVVGDAAELRHDGGTGG